MGVSEIQEREKGARRLFNEIMAKIPKLHEKY